MFLVEAEAEAKQKQKTVYNQSSNQQGEENKERERGCLMESFSSTGPSFIHHDAPK